MNFSELDQTKEYDCMIQVEGRGSYSIKGTPTKINEEIVFAGFDEELNRKVARLSWEVTQ